MNHTNDNTTNQGGSNATLNVHTYLADEDKPHGKQEVAIVISSNEARIGQKQLVYDEEEGGAMATQPYHHSSSNRATIPRLHEHRAVIRQAAYKNMHANAAQLAKEVFAKKQQLLAQGLASYSDNQILKMTMQDRIANWTMRVNESREQRRLAMTQAHAAAKENMVNRHFNDRMGLAKQDKSWFAKAVLLRSHATEQLVNIYLGTFAIGSIVGLCFRYRPVYEAGWVGALESGHNHLMEHCTRDSGMVTMATLLLTERVGAVDHITRAAGALAITPCYATQVVFYVVMVIVTGGALALTKDVPHQVRVPLFVAWAYAMSGLPWQFIVALTLALITFEVAVYHLHGRFVKQCETAMPSCRELNRHATHLGNLVFGATFVPCFAIIAYSVSETLMAP